MKLAFLSADSTVVVREETYDDQWYAQAQAAGNPKVQRLRPLIVDPLPALTATQVADRGPYVIELAQVRITWVVRDKSAAELEADALALEKDQINGYIDDLNTQLNITNATRATLTNAQRINELEKDTRATMKAAKFILRQARRAM